MLAGTRRAEGVFVAITLHVGPPKSGTSILQAALAANRKQLAELGVDFSPVGRVPNHNGELADFIASRPDVPQPAREILDSRRRVAPNASGRWARLTGTPAARPRANSVPEKPWSWECSTAGSAADGNPMNGPGNSGPRPIGTLRPRTRALP